MASTTYNQSFYGQSNLFPMNNMSLAYGQPSYNCYNTDSYFNDSEETSSVASSLHSASKKISKASPVEGTAKRSQKRSNRGRNPWTPKEDAKMMELMKKYGQSWAMISSLMDGRTGKQVRDRYLNKLRPNIKCGDWSLEEDEILVSLCKEIGNRWSLIANHLPGRTEGQVKNRYYSHIKKRLLPDGTYCPNIESRPSSEGFTSFAASPQAEETTFDFGNEVNTNMFNSYGMEFNQAPVNYIYSKGAYAVDQYFYSEQSTTQGPISQNDSESPLRNDVSDAAELISYDTNFYYGQPQADPLYLTPITKDHQVDDMLTKVTDYFTQKSVSDVDSFFADDLRSEVKDSSVSSKTEVMSNDKLQELNRRKAYLELALAKTLKEMKDL